MQVFGHHAEGGLRQGGASVNGEQKPIQLEQVLVRCAQFYSDAREGALEALAAGDMPKYRTLNRQKYEWLAALLAVHRVAEIKEIPG